MTEVIVPAHDEAAVIGRCLAAVLAPPRPDPLHVLVVCNGCRDDTAAIARGFGPPVEVFEIPVASKAAALDHGDAEADGFPRLYVDADVELEPGAVHALSEALTSDAVLAAAPRLAVDTAGASALARSYLRVWSALPTIRDGLVGRGAYAVGAAGRAPLRGLRRCAGRRPAGAHPVLTGGTLDRRGGVHGPAAEDARGILRRRARTLEAGRRLLAGHPELRETVTRSSTAWLDVVREHPRRMLDVPAFLAAGVAARYVARREDHDAGTGWDATTRRAETPPGSPHEGRLGRPGHPQRGRSGARLCPRVGGRSRWTPARGDRRGQRVDRRRVRRGPRVAPGRPPPRAAREHRLCPGREPRAPARGRALLLLLNPDTEPEPGSLAALVEHAERDPGPGLYGGRTLRPDGTPDGMAAWGLPSLWSLTCFASGLSRAFPGSPWFDPEARDHGARPPAPSAPSRARSC